MRGRRLMIVSVLCAASMTGRIGVISSTSCHSGSSMCGVPRIGASVGRSRTSTATNHYDGECPYDRSTRAAAPAAARRRTAQIVRRTRSPLSSDGGMGAWHGLAPDGAVRPPGLAGAEDRGPRCQHESAGRRTSYHHQGRPAAHCLSAAPSDRSDPIVRDFPAPSTRRSMPLAWMARCAGYVILSR
jgi:hypothetical protein